MIVVIADDLTGAGEIGGIGLAYGLKVELQREFSSESSADLLVIDTDTRSLLPEKAGRIIRDVARNLKTSDLPIEWIYKKTDSVLRGPVARELEALQNVMSVSRVLLIPANPSKGRIVHNGNYLINGKPLNETDFANDPEYPANTSSILRFPTLFGAGQIHLLKSDQSLPREGIIVGQAETTKDLLQWSEHINEQIIMAGAGDFFEAVLRKKGFSKRKIGAEIKYQFKYPSLFVSGSSSDSSRQALREAGGMGMEICRMPEELFKSPLPGNKSFQQWIDEITESFKNSTHVVIAIDREAVGSAEFARKLRSIMAQAMLAVARKVSLKEVFVEGGATASEIVNCFGWNRFEPCDQLAPGVVRMKVLGRDTIYLTIKPGSYPWPKDIWKNHA